jgi:ABC-type polysaccharide/polyol phosphate export permease
MDLNQTFDSSRRDAPPIEEFRALIKYRELIRQLISRTIKTRYKRSVLGVAWTMINPLLTMAVLTLVFSQIFRFPTTTYALHVLSGLLVWNFFAQTTTAAMGELMWSGGLLGRIYMPKSAFAVAAVGTGLVNLGLSLVPYLIISIILGVFPKIEILFLPVVVLLASLFTLGVSLLLSTAVVYFQDVLPTYEILLTVWFYLTPVIYPSDVLPAGLQSVLQWNPMFHYVEAFRMILIEGKIPNGWVMLAITLMGVAVFSLGWLIFTRREREYAYRV